MHCVLYRVPYRVERCVPLHQRRTTAYVSTTIDRFYSGLSLVKSRAVLVAIRYRNLKAISSLWRRSESRIYRVSNLRSLSTEFLYRTESVAGLKYNESNVNSQCGWCTGTVIYTKSKSSSGLPFTPFRCFSPSFVLALSLCFLTGRLNSQTHCVLTIVQSTKVQTTTLQSTMLRMLIR